MLRILFLKYFNDTFNKTYQTFVNYEAGIRDAYDTLKVIFPVSSVKYHKRNLRP